MSPKGTVVSGALGPATLPLEAMRQESKREALSGSAAGGRGVRFRGRTVERTAHAHRTGPRTMRSAGNGLLYAGPRDEGGNRAILERLRRDWEDVALLEAIRGERVGMLAGFVRHLEENCLIGGPREAFEARHAIQKHAYLAGELGAQIEYQFDFLENGAYSALLASDIYMLGGHEGGAGPFGGDGEAEDAFVRLVRGRGPRTLQAMTFAARAIRAGVGRDEFVWRMDRENGLYSRRLLGWAFDRVLGAIGGTGPGR